MRDYEYLFATVLQQKLKDKIKGGIFVNVYQDQLYVKIVILYGALTYEKYLVDNFSERIKNGYSTDDAIYEVKKSYQTFLNRTLFYND